MARHLGVVAVVAALGVASTALAASRTESYPAGTFRVTNDSSRIVECTFLVDGHTRNYLKIHVGKAYVSNFDAGHDLGLMCVHSKPDMFKPLKAGVDYRLNNRDGWVGLTEGPAAAPTEPPVPG
ncbi:MAG: hypothetical protein JSR98_11485 [Proteobacteria bacterium]|nr:hypothetical protein [Pseudomonadota bacterium]